MKRAIKLTAMIISLLMLCFVIVSCGKNDEGASTSTETDAGSSTGISISGMTFENDVYSTKVSSNVESFDLKSLVTLASGSSLSVSNTNTFETTFDASSLTLKEGVNDFYLKVTDSDNNSEIYKVSVYRKYRYTVEFNTNGGNPPIASVTVEEGEKISAPSTSKIGYTLSWDYDFNTPITSNTTVNAVWTPNSYKISINAFGEITDVDVQFDAEYDLTQYVPQRSGYIFTGWSEIYNDGEAEIKVDFANNGVYSDTANITVVPNFNLCEYSINYIVDDGVNNPNTVKKFTVEDKIELLPAEWFSDEKRFVGWYTSSSFEESSKITTVEGVANSLELWAKFEDVVYETTVNFVVNGETIKTETFRYKSSYTIAEAVAEKGYIFNGWYLGEEKIELNGVWSYKDQSVELVAKFDERPKEHIYYQIPDGATNTNPSEYDITKGTIKLEDATFGSHIFLGWYTDPEFKNQITELSENNVSDEMTIYSKWQYVSNVTFDANGGECSVESIVYNFGQTYELPVPKSEGNYFVGWYYNGEKVENGEWKYNVDVELVAHWIKSTVVVNYNLGYGTQDPRNPETFEIYSGKIPLYAPTSDIAVFAGWYTDPQFTNAITEIDTDTVREITLYAKWLESSVEYDPNGGSVAKTGDKIIYGAQYKLPTPEYLGYTFDGWYYGDELVSLSGTWSIQADNVELVARWTLQNYKIEYELGGVPISETLVNDYNINSSDIKLPTLTSTNYIFIGWKNSAGMTMENITITSGSTGDLKFEAVWIPKKHADGFVFELQDDQLICIDFDKKVDATQSVKLPTEHYGYKVTAIGTNAFSEFGKAYSTSKYKDYNYYFTVYIPTSIRVIQADAFADCSGMCVMLYLEDGDVVEDYNNTKEREGLLAWEATMTYSIVANETNTNTQVRDCIWGFRPAIGWSRYSAVEIPDYFYDKKN